MPDRHTGTWVRLKVSDTGGLIFHSTSEDPTQEVGTELRERTRVLLKFHPPPPPRALHFADVKDAAAVWDIFTPACTAQTGHLADS